MNIKTLPLVGALVGLSVLAGAWSAPTELSQVWLASELLGMKVVSQDGENVGKIEDVVVRPSGDASYVVLSFGGTLGVNEKLFAMPWSVLRTTEANPSKKDGARTLVLPVVKERLKIAPGFDKKSWPNTANKDWSKDIDAFYAGDLNPNTGRPVDASARTTFITWRATELKGADVTTPTNEKLGDIEELAIDSNGRVTYVTVSAGGFLGMGERVVAVPWDSLKFTLGGDKLDKRIITLDATKETLKAAPEFKSGKDDKAEMCDPKWIGGVYQHFSCPVYWTPKPATEPKSTPKD